MRARLSIGVDPDTEMNGVAIYDGEKRQLTSAKMTLPALLKTLLAMKDKYFAEDRIVVYVEAAWYNRKTTWHVNPKDNKDVCARKGYNVGQVVQRGKDICELVQYAALNDHRISLEPVKPLLKWWQGPDGKITHKEVEMLCRNAQIDWGKKVSSQDERDAVLIALNFADVPFIIDSKI